MNQMSVIGSTRQRMAASRVASADESLQDASATLLWSFQSATKLPYAPLYQDGTLYLGDAAGFIYAVDAATGLGRWSVSTAGRITGMPTVVDRVLYAPNDDFVSLDADRGTLFLQVQSDRRQVSGLAAVNGMVITTGLRIPTGFVQAIDPVTAVEQWRVDVPAVVVGPPQLAGDRLVVATAAGEILAIATATGQVAWRASVPGVMQSPPTVGDDAVFLTSSQVADGFVTALDRATGTERWQSTWAGRTLLSPVLVGRRLVATSDATVRVFDAQTGRAIRNQDRPDAITALGAGPNDTILVGDSTGALAALSAAEGTVRWCWQSSQLLPIAGFSVTGDAIYVVSGSQLMAIAPPQ